MELCVKGVPDRWKDQGRERVRGQKKERRKEKRKKKERERREGEKETRVPAESTAVPLCYAKDRDTEQGTARGQIISAENNIFTVKEEREKKMHRGEGEQGR